MKKNINKISDLYTGLIHDPLNLRRCLMEDLNGNTTLCDSPNALERMESYEALIKPSIAYLWENFDAFCTKVNKQTLLARHEALFNNCTPPKKQSYIDTQLAVWHKMCNEAKHKLIAPVGVTATGKKSKILTSTYTEGSLKEGYGNITTYQAKICIDLFRECIKEKPSVTEKELQDYCIQHQLRIKTKQPPWRIFQYYRAKMIEQLILRRQ